MPKMRKIIRVYLVIFSSKLYDENPAKNINVIDFINRIC